MKDSRAISECSQTGNKYNNVCVGVCAATVTTLAVMQTFSECAAFCAAERDRPLLPETPT